VPLRERVQERRFAQPKVYHNGVHDLTRVQLMPNIREIAKLRLDRRCGNGFHCYRSLQRLSGETARELLTISRTCNFDIAGKAIPEE
jgi:hypothetical protein